MDDKSFAGGNMLHATLPSSDLAEKLPIMPNKKMLRKWRLVSLFSLTPDEARDTLQRLESYRSQPDNSKVEWLNEAINSLKRMITVLETDSVLDALLKANSAGSLMVIAKELIAVRKEQREKVESALLDYGTIAGF